MRKVRTKKLYAGAADRGFGREKVNLEVKRTSCAIEVFSDGHPLVDVSTITGRVFLYVDLKVSHGFEFVKVGRDGTYVPSMYADEVNIIP